MKLFNKIAKGANRLFHKLRADPHIFRKISNTASDINSIVHKVGNFLTPMATAYNPALGLAIQGGVQGTNQIANSLEKVISGHKKNEYERNRLNGI